MLAWGPRPPPPPPPPPRTAVQDQPDTSKAPAKTQNDEADDPHAQQRLPSLVASSAPLPTVQQLLALFQCSVCYSLCTPEIRQCRNGHLTCNGCLSRLVPPASKSCPVCRAPAGGAAGGGARNLVGEQILMLLNPLLQCDQGCEKLVRLADLPGHDRVCVNRPFHCPEVLCAARLPKKQLERHFFDSHTYQVVEGRGMMANFGLRPTQPEPWSAAKAPCPAAGWCVGANNQWMTKVFCCYDTCFFACVLTVKSELYVWLWHLGEEGAQRFRSKVRHRI